MTPAVSPTRSCIVISGNAALGSGSTVGVILATFGFGLAFLDATLAATGASGVASITSVVVGTSEVALVTTGATAALGFVLGASTVTDASGVILETVTATGFAVVFLVALAEVDFVAVATGVSGAGVVFFIMGLRRLRAKKGSAQYFTIHDVSILLRPAIWFAD